MSNNKKKKAALQELQAKNLELKSTLNKYPKMSEDERKMQIRNLVHNYNEMKDAAQIFIGALANIDGLTIRRVHENLLLPLE